MTEFVVVALDIGGTGIKCGLVDADGRVRHAERHDTGAERGPQAVLDGILTIAAGLADRARAEGLHPAAVGIAVPGVVDDAAGVAVWSSNLGFRDVPLRELAAARLGLPVALGHDVRAAGVAEARLGPGRGHRNVLFVAIGTGIAAAHLVDGVAYPGAHGAAGELGHVLLLPDGPVCGCGQRGCLEALASAAAIGRRYAAEVGGPPSAERVVHAAAGDPVAARIWTEAVSALADGLLTAQALFDPELVVLGGGLAEAGETLLAPLRDALRQRATFHRGPRLARAALGDGAGRLGAALLALDTLEAR